MLLFRLFGMRKSLVRPKIGSERAWTATIIPFRRTGNRLAEAISAAIPMLLLISANGPANAQSLQITSVTDNHSAYPNGRIPQYGKLEISFQVVNSVARNLQFSYDSTPPAGIEAGTGISVEAQLSPNNWQTTYTQPGFYYQHFDDQLKNGREWFYPTGAYSWKVRFAPPATGTWQYRLVARDASGNTQSSTYSVVVTASENPGFIRVSPNDSRYFEFENGEYFPALGYNMNFNRIDWEDPVAGNTANFEAMSENGIQLVRAWLSEWGIFGSAWNPWNAQESSLHSRYIPFEGITFSTSYPGSEVSMVIAEGNNSLSSCMFIGWVKARPAVKRNTNYRVRVRYREDAVTGPRIAGQPYGFVVKTGSWLGETCADPGIGSVVAATYPGSWQVLSDEEPEWSILEGTLNSGNSDFLPMFYLILENAVGGRVNVDYVWVEESLGAGLFGPNIISKPWMAHHQYFEQRNSHAFDKVLELAEEQGIYLRLVVLEKNEWIQNHLGGDGQFTWTESNDNFYGNNRNTTKVRWLQRQWWRYLQARWGYSTNIHSWELLNEGDPYSGRHHVLADEFGKYMHQFVPNDHLVSTSNWSSFPKQQFWANASYPDIDFADVHLYVPKNAAYSLRVDTTNFPIATAGDYADTAWATFNLAELIGDGKPQGAGKPVIRGETGFVLTGSEPFDPELLADRQGVWLHNLIWGGIGSGGVIESYWYDAEHIYGRSGDGVDLRYRFKSYFDFISSIPLSIGSYQDAAATVSNSQLRAWGQKDLTNGRAHLWIQNKQHTWRNVLAGSVSAQSGTVQISGFNAGGGYPVDWWNTNEGIVQSSATITANAQGVLTLQVNSLASDVAVRIGDYSGRPLPPVNLRVTVN